jgi:hypothetical protein
MAKLRGLPWDAVLSAELFHHFKPDREVYLGAVDLLGCAAHEVMARWWSLSTTPSWKSRRRNKSRTLSKNSRRPGRRTACAKRFFNELPARKIRSIWDRLS